MEWNGTEQEGEVIRLYRWRVLLTSLHVMSQVGMQHERNETKLDEYMDVDGLTIRKLLSSYMWVPTLQSDSRFHRGRSDCHHSSARCICDDLVDNIEYLTTVAQRTIQGGLLLLHCGISKNVY